MRLLDDIPAYRKHREHSVKKSNHKHEYLDCLFECFNSYYKGTCCGICNKVGYIDFIMCEKIEGRSLSRILRSEEVKEHFKHLPGIHIKSSVSKYGELPTSK